MRSSKAVSAAILFTLLAVSSLTAAADSNKSVVKSGGEGDESPSPSSYSGGLEGFARRLGEPERRSAAVSLLSSYDPDFNVSSLLGSVAVIYDHGYLWDRIRSGNTAFKLEASAGSMVRPDARIMASLNMLSVYFPPVSMPAGLRFYLEAGIGGIYTDYRVDGQAYRLLFNPQAGIGTEIAADGSSYFIAMRLHHTSNAGINKDNQGLNSLLVQFGRCF